MKEASKSEFLVHSLATAFFVYQSHQGHRRMAPRSGYLHLWTSSIFRVVLLCDCHC